MNAESSGVQPLGTCLVGCPQVLQALAVSFLKATSTKEFSERRRAAAALSATAFKSAGRRNVMGTIAFTHHNITVVVS